MICTVVTDTQDVPVIIRTFRVPACFREVSVFLTVIESYGHGMCAKCLVVYVSPPVHVAGGKSRRVDASIEREGRRTRDDKQGRDGTDKFRKPTKRSIPVARQQIDMLVENKSKS